MPRRAVFLDRDDTLIRNSGHAPDGDLGDPDLVELLPGAHEACTLLTAAGYPLFVVTNQGGVARGRFTEDDVLDVHNRLSTLLDGAITDYRYCPFHPEGALPAYTREHPWRKPQPGMLLDLADHHDLDLARSWMIGDAVRDCDAGRAAGCTTVLIADAAPDDAPSVDHTARDVLAAARIVLAHADREVTTIALSATGDALGDPPCPRERRGRRPRARGAQRGPHPLHRARHERAHRDARGRGDRRGRLRERAPQDHRRLARLAHRAPAVEGPGLITLALSPPARARRRLRPPSSS
ncbi:MAG: HAD family hydrolase [Planctomycetota bacterium]